MIKTATIVAVTLIGVAAANSALAKQYTKQIRGKEVVVHTNPIPVILHRMVPPQHGKHVTVKEMETGKLPAATTNSNVGQESGLLRQRRAR